MKGVTAFVACAAVRTSGRFGAGTIELAAQLETLVLQATLGATFR
jgi:hypothetical protein